MAIKPPRFRGIKAPTFKLPAIKVSRRLTRLPRFGKPKNPFKAGTSSIKRRTGNAAKKLGLASGVLAATPGTGYIGGALGGLLAGPVGAAKGFAVGAAADYAATAGLGLAANRRRKLMGYLNRRSKRKSGPGGVYKEKGMSHIEDALGGLSEAIEKAKGLIRGGSTKAMRRVGQLKRREQKKDAKLNLLLGTNHDSSGRFDRAMAYLRTRNRGHGQWKKGVGAYGQTTRRGKYK